MSGWSRTFRVDYLDANGKPAAQKIGATSASEAVRRLGFLRGHPVEPTAIYTVGRDGWEQVK